MRQIQIKQRWITLWERVEAAGDGREAYNDLAARYKKPRRYYHTISHIEHCLKEFDLVWHLAAGTNADAIRMAIWFHDAIYNTKARDNEEKSAELARTILKKAFLPDEFMEKVVNLILATKHAAPPADPDAKLIADIDLSSLGLPYELFDKNSRLIQKEYKHVPKKLFMRGRSEFLKSFLQRKAIYSTQFFYDKYEAQARKNIARAIANNSK